MTTRHIVWSQGQQDRSNRLTAFKTVSMRIRGTSVEELEDAGLATDGLIESTAKLQSQVKALSGVDIMLDADTYKSTYQIMLEIAKAWDNISDINRAALLESLAGKRNSQVLMSVIQNLDDLTGSYEAAQNAAGTMEEANAIAMDTITGKTKALSASWQELSGNLLDSGIIKFFVDLARVIVETANGFIMLGDGAGGTFLIIATAVGSLVTMLPAAIGSVTKLVNSLKELRKIGAVTKAGGALSGLLGGLTAGKILLIAGAITAAGTLAVWAYKKFKKFNQTFDELKEKAADAKTELENLRDEQQKIAERIVELDTLAQTGDLTLTDAQELEMLREKNRLLEAQISLRKQAASDADNKVRTKAQSEASDFFNKKEGHWIIDDNSTGGYIADVTGFEAFQLRLDEYLEAREDYYNAIKIQDEEATAEAEERMSVLSDALSVDQSDMSARLPYLDANSAEFKQIQKMIDEYTAKVGDAEQKTKLFQDVLSRDEYSVGANALNELASKGKLTHDSLVDLYKSNPAVAELLDYLAQLGLISLGNMTTLANQLNTVAEAASNLNIQDISTYLEETQEKVDILVQAQEDMDKMGVISSGTLKDLMDNYGSLGGYLVQTADGYKLSNGALSTHLALLKAEAATKLNEAIEAAKQYCKVTLDEKDAIDQKAESLQNELAMMLALSAGSESVDSAYFRMYGTSAPAGVEKIQTSVAQLKQIKDDLDNALAGYVSQGNINTDAHTSDSDSDSYKERIEKEIKIKQHQREMNEITDEQYYAFLREKLAEYMKYEKKYEEEIWDLREELYSGYQDLVNDWVSDQEKAAERFALAGNVESQLALYRNIIDRVEGELAKAYEDGLDENSDYVQELESQIQSAADNILDITKSMFDDFISYADDFNVWKDLDIAKVEVLEQKLKEIDKLLEDGTLSWKEYVDAHNEAAKDLYDTQKESIETIIDLTMEMIEQEADDQIEALEKQMDAYDELIEKKKELLQETKDEKDHEKEVAEIVREISKLQSRITQLALDDSQQAVADKAKLEEELYEKQKELQDLQSDYAIDKTIEQLDKSKDATEEAIEDEKEAIEESVDSWVKKYNAAIKRIDNDWEGLYEDLEAWMAEHRDSIDGPDSLVTAWKNAAKIKSEYANTKIEDIYDGLGSTGIDPSLSSGNGNTAGAGYSIVQKMYGNSVAAKNDPALKDGLNAENFELAADFFAATGKKLHFNKYSGQWHIGEGGPLLYEEYGLPKYHTGGYVGDAGAVNDKEVLSLLEKGELVLTKGHQINLKSMFSLLKSLTAIHLPRFGSGGSFASGDLNANIAVNITHNGTMTAEDAHHYGDIAGEAALNKLRSAFLKRGVR